MPISSAAAAADALLTVCVPSAVRQDGRCNSGPAGHRQAIYPGLSGLRVCSVDRCPAPTDPPASLAGAVGRITGFRRWWWRRRLRSTPAATSWCAASRTAGTTRCPRRRRRPSSATLCPRTTSASRQVKAGPGSPGGARRERMGRGVMKRGSTRPMGDATMDVAEHSGIVGLKTVR